MAATLTPEQRAAFDDIQVPALPFRVEQLGDGRYYLIFAPPGQPFDRNLHRSTPLPTDFGTDVAVLWAAFRAANARIEQLEAENDRLLAAATEPDGGTG